MLRACILIAYVLLSLIVSALCIMILLAQTSRYAYIRIHNIIHTSICFDSSCKHFHLQIYFFTYSYSSLFYTHYSVREAVTIYPLWSTLSLCGHLASRAVIRRCFYRVWARLIDTWCYDGTWRHFPMSIEGYLEHLLSPKTLCRQITVSQSILDPRTRFKARFGVFTLIWAQCAEK